MENAAKALIIAGRNFDFISYCCSIDDDMGKNIGHTRCRR